MKRINTIAALLAMAAVSAFALGVAEGGADSSVEASGPTVSETRDLSSFDSVVLSGSGAVRYRQADSFRVTVTARESVLARVVSQVTNDKLVLRVEKGFTIRGDGHIEYLVECPELSGIEISGSGTFTAMTPLTGDTVSADISGSGNISAEVDAKAFKSTISGSGDIKVQGRAETLEFRNSGSGALQAQELAARRADITLSGSGSAEVAASDYLKVRSSGSGTVSYRGKPQIDVASSGSGRISPLD